MAGGNRVLTKDLDTRLKALEDRLSEMAATVGGLVEQTRQAQADAQAAVNRCAEAETAASRIAESQATAVNHSPQNGNGNGEADDQLMRLQEVVGRLDERVEKITQTLITQASRLS